MNMYSLLYIGFPDGSVVKNLPASAGDVRDVVSISGLGRSPGEGNGNLLQYSWLENPMDRGAWRAIVHGVEKSWTFKVLLFVFLFCFFFNRLKI